MSISLDNDTRKSNTHDIRCPKSFYGYVHNYEH